MPNLTLSQTISYLETSVNKTNYRRKHDVLVDFFSCIDAPQKAYWLGFLYADGNISSSNQRSWHMSFALAEEDGYMVEALRDELNPSKTISVKRLKRSLEKETYQDQLRVCVHSNRLALDLINLNCIPNKSLVLKFPESNQVPDALMGHFIRGFFDGDGAFVKASQGRLVVKFISSHAFINGLKEKLEQFGISSSIYKANYGRNSSLYIFSFERIVVLANLMYDNNSVLFLKRKRELFHDWCDKIKLDINKEKQFSPEIKRETNGKFSVRFSFDGKRKHIGTYDSIELALLGFQEYTKKFKFSLNRLERKKLESINSIRFSKPIYD